jgi:lipid II:glycine glycyltransferase (peptidoglycan interpeptide bridge formation enzyme)
MSYIIKNHLNEINSKNWEQFVFTHPQGNFFQTPQFIDFISSIKGYQPVNLIALNSDNIIEGVLCGALQKEGTGIKAYCSTRLIVWGGPLVHNENIKITILLIDYLVKTYSKNCIYTEFRNTFDMSVYQSIFMKYNFKYKPHLNYLVKTDSLPLVKKRMSESKFRQIKTSVKNGAIISEAGSENEIQNFYNLLQTLYREKVKKPFPPLAFFMKFYHSKELGKIFLIKKEDNIIGGILCPIFKNKIIYEWYICSQDNLKNMYPGVLATWAPIEYGLNNGFEHFDFMGAGSPDLDYGVREFKEKFGGELVEYGRFKKITNPFLYTIGETALKLKNKIKI